MAWLHWWVPTENQCRYRNRVIPDIWRSKKCLKVTCLPGGSLCSTGPALDWNITQTPAIGLLIVLYLIRLVLPLSWFYCELCYIHPLACLQVLAWPVSCCPFYSFWQCLHYTTIMFLYKSRIVSWYLIQDCNFRSFYEVSYPAFTNCLQN